MSRQMIGICVAVVGTAAFLGADPVRQVKNPPAETAQFRDVPVGAIKIPLRDCQQPDDYSCGTCAFMSVCSYYGVGPKRLDAFKIRLRTTQEEGTGYKRMMKYAEK